MIRRVFASLATAALLGVPDSCFADLLFDGGEFQVNAYTTNGQSIYGTRAVARNDDGSFVVVWHSFYQDGDGQSIQARRFDAAGAPLGTEVQVNTYTTGFQQTPSVSSASGAFVVVWTSVDQDGDNFGVFGQRFDASGAAAGPEFGVNTYTTGSQDRHSVASASDGSFMVVWSSDGPDGSFFGVQGRRYDAGGAPDGTEFSVNTFTTDSQFQPSIAATDADGFVVVWTSEGQDGDGFSIHGQRFDAGGALAGTEFQVNTYTTANQIRPAVASKGDGFVVVWDSDGPDGNSLSVQARRFDGDGTPLGTEFQLNSYTTNGQNISAVAMAADQSFVAVWNSVTQDGSVVGIHGQRIDGAGNPAGTEFRVNSYTTGNQFSASIAADAAGDFVVVWDSFNGQDGHDTGVFGQRLCDDTNGNALCDSQEPACGAAPALGCSGGAKASLQIKHDPDNDKKDQIKWTLSKGDAFDQNDLGDPIATRRYSLCIYDESAEIPSLVATLAVEPGPAWTNKAPKGFVYKDSAGAQAGVKNLLLKTGEQGKTKVSLKAKGAASPMPIPLSLTEYFDLDSALTVQLVNDEDATCWSTEFTSAKVNTPEQFKATAP